MSLQLVNKASGKKITIQKNDSCTLGRGPEIECLDKRISRKHISISFTKEQAIVTVLNNNPCFIMKNGSIIIKKKGDEIVLMPGDVLSLLPDFQSCAFDVSYCSNVDIAPGSPSLLEEQLPNSNSKCNNQPDSCDYDNLQSMADKENENISPNATLCVEHETNSYLDRPSPTATPDLVQSADLSTCLIGNGDCDMANRPLTAVTPDFIQTEDSTTGIAKASNLFEHPSNSQVTDDCYPDYYSKSPLPKFVSNGASLIIKTEIIDYPDTPDAHSSSLMDDTNNDIEGSPAKRQALSSNLPTSSREASLVVKLEPVLPPLPNELSRSRSLCRYGQSCYRKNQQHKNEFSHPGDGDWVSEEQKPLCPFDPYCYRKCPDHRINMRHTSDRQNAPAELTFTPSLNELDQNYDWASSEYEMDSDSLSSDVEE